MTKFIDSFSQEVWDQTYRYNDEATIDDTFRRIAKAIASMELTPEKRLEWEEKFFELLSDFTGVPGGRIISNAGTNYKGTTLLNCFVSPRNGTDLDSLDQIINDLKNQAFTLKSEGGWGQNFSWIRPRGSFIHGIGVESPGAVKYMELFDKASEIITSGSGKKKINAKGKKKIRKGAMMGILSCWHPDVVEGITAKQHQGRLSKFNISINCTNDFMEKITGADPNDSWDLVFPDTTFEKYKEEWDGDITEWKAKGYPIVVYQTVSAKWLWDTIMESTYNRAEPGVIFLDRANEWNTVYYRKKAKLIASNPCGEQILPAGGVCDLGSMNLTQFINPDGTFNFTKFRKYVSYMVRFLDNVNDYTLAPLSQYKDFLRDFRRIGVGVMGWGSLLVMMGIKFASPEASALRDQIMDILRRTAYETSIDLAEEKGMFPLCDPILHAAGKFVQEIGLSDEYIDKLCTYGIRNSSLISIQPNGNTGVYANVVSGGLEPIFSDIYTRTVIVNSIPDEILHLTPKFYEGEWMETELFKFTKEGDEDVLRGEFNGTVYKIDKGRGLLKEVECKDYSVRYLESLGKWDRNAPYIVPAHELTAQQHLDDLIGFMKYIDSSASKTINLPYEYPFESFKDIYLNAYKSGYVKGVTTYRSGTMAAVLSLNDTNGSNGDEEIILDTVKMNESSDATMKILRAEGRKWYMTVVWNESKTRPFAIFVQTNHPEKTVTTNDAVDLLFELAEKKKIPMQHIDDVKNKVSGDINSRKITRALSLLLRHGVSIKDIVNTLSKVENVIIGSFLFQITKYLSTLIKDGEKVEGEKCSSCEMTGTLVYQEGCKVCKSCGSSKCG